MATCALCGRDEDLTRHHLVPRCRHANRRNKRDFAREIVHQTVGLCRPCHKQVHAVLSEKQLEREWNTIPRLLSHPEIARFVDWIRSKPIGFRCTTSATRNRRDRGTYGAR